MKKKPIEYVNNKQFHAAIVEYRENVTIAIAEGKEPPRIPNYIGECITKIAEKLSTKPCFINYSFRDEMVSDGIENCILYFHDYDPNWTAKRKKTDTLCTRTFRKLLLIPRAESYSLIATTILLRPRSFTTTSMISWHVLSEKKK